MVNESTITKVFTVVCAPIDRNGNPVAQVATTACVLESTARRVLSSERRPRNTKIDLTRIREFDVLTYQGVQYVPLNAVPLITPTNTDVKNQVRITDRMEAIKRAKELGISTKDIALLLNSRVGAQEMDIISTTN